MVKQYEEQLGSEKILPLIVKMTIPAVTAQLVNLLYNIVDRIYIGHIRGIGTDALAGVGICNTLIILVAAFSQIVGGGGAPIAAIALGRGDRERAEKTLGNGTTFLLICSAVLMAVLYIFMRPLLRLTGGSDATLPYAVTYFSIYLTGTFFVMVSTGLNAFINTQGRPGIAMVSTLVGAALNIVLDPILIFGFHMGVAGAAIATVISQAVSAAWILYFLLSRNATLRIRKNCLRPDREIMLSMTGLGVSPFIMASTESLIGFVLNGSLAVYGDIYVSALTIMQSALQFVSVPLTGFSQGCIPILSYNYGHANVRRVKDAYRILLAVEFFYGFALIVFMIVFPGLTARIFTNDAALIAVVKKAMPVFLAGMSIFGLQRACQNTFVALDQAKISIFIALLRKVILLIPLALILPHFMGVTGVFAAEAIADATAAICCTVIFAIRFPKILQNTADRKEGRPEK
jgi:putative MATE family efflux protein